MRKKVTKIAAAVLAVATVGTMFIGCNKHPVSSASSGTASLPVADVDFKASKPITVDMLFCDQTTYPEKDSWDIWKQITAKTNVTIKPQVVGNTIYNDRRTLLLSSGDEPEVIPKTYSGSEVPYIPGGQIIPVSDYLSQLPNFAKEVKDWNLQGDVDTNRQKDGKYYILPGLHESYTQDYSLVIRKDMLDAAGLKEPNTWEEVESVLKKIHEKYPDISPWSDMYYLCQTTVLMGPAYGLQSTGLSNKNWNNKQSLYWDKKTDKFSFWPSDPRFKSELTYLNKLVKEGLLDKQSATNDDDPSKAVFINGKTFMMCANTQVVNELRNKCDKSFKIEKINVPAGPAGAFIAGNRLENGVLITKKAKDSPNFNDILRFVDWLWYSKTAGALTRWGVEGQTYTKDSDGIYTLKDGYTCTNLGLKTANTQANPKDIRVDMGYGSGVFILTYGGSDELAYSYMNDETKEFVKNVNKTRTLLPVQPTILYDDEEMNSQNMINTTLCDYFNQMAYKFIVGTASLDKDWGKYTDELKSKQVDTYVSNANKAYKAQKASSSKSSSK